MPDVEDLRRQINVAMADPAAGDARRAACTVCADALAGLGHSLWLGGWVTRDDAAVGLAVVVQIGGELAVSAVELLAAGHHYAAAALVRQLVEVEYLVWAFGDGAEDPADWLHATPAGIRELFAPARMRKKAGGRFRASEYWSHCDHGGHPNPAARHLLPDHSSPLGGNEWMWADLGQHLDRLWSLLGGALDRHGWPAPVEDGVRAILARWHEHDPLADRLPIPD